MKNTTIAMLACAVLAVSSTCLAEPSGDAQFSGASSGLEGRERELGLALGVVLKTMHETSPTCMNSTTRWSSHCFPQCSSPRTTT